jgi:uncharacterized membrane protein HdeD (DUF308 family)
MFVVLSQTKLFMKALLLPAIAGKFVIGCIVCIYFWNATTMNQVSLLPIWLLILTVVYIALQMFSRKYSAAGHWWDWVYYIGLLSIMIPVSIINAGNEALCHLATDFGTLFLIAPPIADTFVFFKKSTPES